MKKSKLIFCLMVCCLMLFSAATLSACGKEKCMVIFSENGAPANTLTNFPEPQTVVSGKKAVRPSPDPTRSNDTVTGYSYEFLGWFTTKDGDDQFDFNTPITEKRTVIFAHWELKIIYYDVVFDFNYSGAPAPETFKVEQGKIAEPPSGAREGYRLVAWSLSPTVREDYNFEINKIRENIKFYAFWEKEWAITYHNYYTGGGSMSVIYTEKETPYEPANPACPEGDNYIAYYAFDGWYKDAGLTQGYVFAPLTGDLDLYPKWTRTHYDLTLDYNYPGGPMPIVKVAAGTSPISLPPPTREDYVFNGWYTDAGCTALAGLVTKDITLYAKWVQVFNVVFDLNYSGLVHSTQKVEVNRTAAEPSPLPTREGYSFAQWFTDSACTAQYDFAVPITHDITLYAKWVQVYTVTFDLNYGGLVYGTQKISSGQKAAEPSTPPIREDYEFEGWYTDATFTALFDFNARTITADTVIYAKWVRIYTVAFDWNYSGSTPYELNVRSGSAVSPPSVPSREGYRFDDWYADSACTTPYVFGTPVTADTTVYAKWVRIYTVTFSMNYGGIVYETQTVDTGDLAAEPSTDPSRTNYRFDGWYADSACTIPYNFAAPVTADTTICAKWVRIYTITFSMNYGGNATYETQIVDTGSLAAEPSTDPSRTNYRFDGWYADSDCTAAYNFGTPVTANTTIYAKWVRLYTVAFNLNDGSGGAYDTQTVDTGSLAVRPSADPTRTNYRFDGWYADAACTMSYIFSTPVTANTTIYAKWVRTYTVTFSLNDGSGGVYETQIVDTGVSAVRPSTDPTRSGYVFIDWVTASGGTTAYTFPPVTGDTTVYARWVRIYTVTFSLNYGGGGAYDTQTVRSGDSAAVPTPNPTRSGSWSFLYWATDSSGANEYDFGAVTADITLYAHWFDTSTQTTYFDVTFYLNYTGATEPYGVQSILEGNSATRPLTNPTRDGYRFVDWVTTSGGTSPYAFGAVTGVTSVYARWIQTFTVTFSLNDGSGGVYGTQTVDTGASAVRPSTDPGRTDYRFDGWYADSACTILYAFGTPVTANTTVYAKWVRIYTVTFSLNYGGGGAYDTQNVDTGAFAVRPSADPGRTDYRFDGWYADSACTTPYVFSTPVAANTTIYAKWVRIYTVTFSMNYGGNAAYETQIVDTGSLAVRPSTDPDRANYRFDGWYADSACTIPYVFDTPVAANTTIYAKWVRIYTVTFSMNYGGNAAYETQIVDTGSLAVRPSADPTRTNYRFDGWYADSDCTISYAFGTPVTADTTIYAKWVRTYTVTFSLNDGSGGVYETQIVDTGVSAVRPSTDPTRSGYVFINWVTTSSGTTAYTFPPVTGNTTVYARWEMGVTVTFDLNYPGPAPILKTVVSGSPVSAPNPAPEREGYVLSGWYEDSACTILYNFSAQVTASKTLYANWLAAHTVTFDLQYGGLKFTQKVVDGGLAVQPPDPEQEGYRFLGWKNSATSSVTFDFKNTNITADITIYARWVQEWTVIFYDNYDGSYDETGGSLSIKVDHEQRISLPPNPVRGDQWMFTGWYWYNEDDEIVPFDSYNTNIVESISVFARWVRSEYNITWDWNYSGAGAPAETQVRAGGVAREPANRPSRPSMTITGWYYDAALTLPFAFGSPIEEDLVLYAKWEVGYTFRLDYNYAGAPSKQADKYGVGDIIPAKPADPTQPADPDTGYTYTFTGWSTTPDGETYFADWGTPFTGDVILYAQWRHTHVFEVEYTYVDDLKGAGWSGGAEGKNMLMRETVYWLDEYGNMQTEYQDGYTLVQTVSNDFFIAYLNTTDTTTLTFEIYSDRAATATLYLRLSMEAVEPIKTLSNEEYQLWVNGEFIPYGTAFNIEEVTGSGEWFTGVGVVFYDCYSAMTIQKRPFSDIVEVTIDLVEGYNVIQLVVDNDRSPGGTMKSTAPLVDCIKIDTVAQLDWYYYAHTENIIGK